MPEVSIALGQLLPKTEQLQRRDPEDERLFDYSVCFYDGENWRTFRFSVDDCTAQDHPIVVAVSHRLGRTRERF